MITLRLTPHARLTSLILMVLLVFAQWVIINHELDQEQHQANHVCEWCLTHAQLAKAGAATHAGLPVTLGTSVLLAPIESTVFRGRFHSAYSVRAPPIVFSL